MDTEAWKNRCQDARLSGLRHSVFFVNGDNYVGEWKDNKMHGKGKYVWKSSAEIYSGDWLEGTRCGHGVLSLLHDGKYTLHYVGQWENDKRQGYGTQNYFPNGRYEGTWFQDQRHGIGKMWYDNGSSYEGQWKHDSRSGWGTLTYANGNTFEGAWKDDVRHGTGAYTFVAKQLTLEAAWMDDIPKSGVLRGTEVQVNEFHLDEV